MANYCCAVRTNYFRVKDEDKFTEFMNNVVAECEVNVWRKELLDQTYFGFGCYGQINGVRVQDDDPNNADPEDEEISYDAFIDDLQDLVEDGDAIIIFESGNENLRYVVGEALVITATDYQFINLDDVAVEAAGKLLGRHDYATVCSY